MFSNTNISLIFDIAFFIGCIILISHMFFSSHDCDIRKSAFAFLLIYGVEILVYYIFTHRNTANYGISVGSSIGGTIGFIAGFYLGYQACIFARIFDGVGHIESSSISVGISFGFAEMFRLIGSTLGNILLTI